MRALLGLALAALATPVFGATLSVVSAGATAVATDEDGLGIAEAFDFPTNFDTISEGRAVSGRADLRPQGFDFSSSGSGDIRSGAFSATVEKGAGFGEVLGAGGFVQEFTAHGSGEVTFNMGLSGYWETDLPGPDDQRCCGFELWSPIQIESANGFDFAEFVVNPFDPDFVPSGKVSHKVSYTALVEDGSDYTISSFVQAVFHQSRFTGPVTGSAALDGVFSYAAGDGVSLEFADPEFLATPVPLPAGWMLLVGAIGAAWAVRRPPRRIIPQAT